MYHASIMYDDVMLCREFVGCVRCIRILSPAEVKQMGEEGMQLLNSAAGRGIQLEY